MNIKTLLIIYIILICLCSSAHSRAQERQMLYRSSSISPSTSISPSMSHPLESSELTAQAMSDKTNQRLLRPASKSNKFNVMISEPVNCTKGEDILGACALHDQNFFGENITIAIIDQEFYVDRLSERELPKKRYNLYSKTFSNNEIHGTGCAEIIGDIAPNATLYMINVKESSEYGFREAVDELRHLNKQIDIVSCSLDFPFSTFDDSDNFCSNVRNLTKNGTIWINAAGDDARRHWYGTFRDENGNSFNEFNQSDESLQVTMKRGMPLTVRLSWNDSWNQANQDYDLYVYAPDGSYVISKNTQNGYSGQEPTEKAEIIAPVYGNYSIKIKKYNVSRDNVAFQLFSSENLLKYDVQNYSLGILASCPEVITVGAVDAFNWQLENYSSMGPTIDGRQKPELMAPDNITTSSYFPEKFKGSSASAPFAAGIFALALEKGRKLGLSDAEIKHLLLDTAIDLGPPGAGNEYGYGLINLKGFEKL